MKMSMETIMHDVFPRLRDFVIPVTLVVILSVVSMKLCPFPAPPTVLNSIVVGVSDTIHASQIIRGSIINRMPYQISFDGETWSKHLTLTCDQVGVVIVKVKRPKNGGYDVLETAVIVQDSLGQCEEFYGP